MLEVFKTFGRDTFSGMYFRMVARSHRRLLAYNAATMPSRGVAPATPSHGK